MEPVVGQGLTPCEGGNLVAQASGLQSEIIEAEMQAGRLRYKNRPVRGTGREFPKFGSAGGT